jgi:hypothetical protein
MEIAMLCKRIVAALAATLGLCAQQDTSTHQDHSNTVSQRGDQVMGFSHEKTTHHFRLFPDGGAIEVTANDPGDAESRAQIRTHLSHIAGMFASGDFDAPMLIHSRVPPGVPVLKRLKTEVAYTFEEMDGGGRVRIRTGNRKALAAVYQFLRFQIADHQTGDATGITQPADEK